MKICMIANHLDLKLITPSGSSFSNHMHNQLIHFEFHQIHSHQIDVLQTGKRFISTIT